MTCAALLCALYLDAGLAVMAPPGTPRPGNYWPLDRNHVANPYGVLAIGLEYELTPRWAARFELRHESSVATPRDVGENSAGVFVRWRPWR